MPEDDPKRRNPDISLISSKLKWKPKYDLKFGLNKTIAYFKNK
jgi:UDP-glucuronate decarboxylase